MSKPRIRDSRPEDFGRGLLECLSSLAATSFAGREWREGDIRKARHHMGVQTFVAVDDAQNVVGTASVFLYPSYLHGGSWRGHVEDVVVHPDHRDRGVGRSLIEHCLTYCRLHDCRKVVLNCEQENVGFYEKCGFRRTPDGFMRADLQ